MSWQAVARKDFADAVRSRWLWALSLLFIGVFSIPTVARLYFGTAQRQAGSNSGVVQLFIFFMKEGVAIFVPLIAIVVAYAALSRERESGTIKLLLSLPHSRSDVVFGKVLGRSAVIALPIIVGFVVAGITLLPAASGFEAAKYVQFAFLTALLGVVFVGLSVGVSAASKTNRQAMVGAVGLYTLATFFWNPAASKIADGVKSVLGLSATDRIFVLLFMKLMNPVQAYKTLVDSIVMGSALEARKSMFGFFIFRDPAASKALGNQLPLAFSDPFTVVYLLFWLFVPVAIGLELFRRSDL